ncbi:MAG TPA: alpha-amylase family protein [Acidimicrobiales bacterium]|nr:alpha-amylase family protein [Acidimicrobiales bacterium]
MADRPPRRAPIEATADVWWKNAIIYCLDVETFLDANGDGVGDLDGLMTTVDYLAGLGVTCLWLMPVHPTPNRDDGYDITDYYAVDERLGTLGDLVEAVRLANDRGIRVILDLVVNHTSDQHPWFLDARSSPDARHRDWYVWTDDPDAQPFDTIVFPDSEDSAWTWDEEAGQHYLHRFYRHQPDLNIANPEVRDAIGEIAGFWLAQGIAGFRVDAVPYLLETDGLEDDLGMDPHHMLRDLRRQIGRRRGDAALLGEVNLPPDEARRFFGDGDELDMAFNFHANQHMWLALAREESGPLLASLRDLPDLPTDATWANFVRSHDELNVGRLAEDERAEVFAAFGPDEDMQLFGRGLRRRLAPMMGGDLDRIRMVYSLMFSLPGAAVLYYGEEIGMGENLDVPGRLAVRTPMQWADGDRAGFSAADPSALLRPPPDGPYGPDHVNVTDAERTDGSLLSWMERLIRLRRGSPEVGWGEWEIVESAHEAVVALRHTWGDRALLAVHNLASEPVDCALSWAPDPGTRIHQTFDGGARLAVDEGRATSVSLDRYGTGWFKLVDVSDGQVRVGTSP